MIYDLYVTAYGISGYQYEDSSNTWHPRLPVIKVGIFSPLLPLFLPYILGDKRP